ncbi:MAG: NfeD family protein [Myxococcales bacterium]|jgi:membrane protein implicated in regulation of membrane protease activity|nr:NfeD family protein [Myxococcales bacterium]
MDSSIITYIWLFAGIALAVSEIFLPGFIVIFLGVAAMLVAGLRGLGIVESLLPSLLIWAGLSTLLIAGVGRALRKRIPAERTVAIADEDAALFGHVVDVVDAIQPGKAGGRIRLQGTTWDARTAGKEPLPAGSQARLVDRDNLSWIVEPILPSHVFSAPVELSAPTTESGPERTDGLGAGAARQANPTVPSETSKKD